MGKIYTKEEVYKQAKYFYELTSVPGGCELTDNFRNKSVLYLITLKVLVENGYIDVYVKNYSPEKMYIKNPTLVWKKKSLRGNAVNKIYVLFMNANKTEYPKLVRYAKPFPEDMANGKTGQQTLFKQEDETSKTESEKTNSEETFSKFDEVPGKAENTPKEEKEKGPKHPKDEELTDAERELLEKSTVQEIWAALDRKGYIAMNGKIVKPNIPEPEPDPEPVVIKEY